jgi:hypothetical protein
MSAPRPDIADLLDVDVPLDGKVITVSDLHLPPVRTDVSGRCCEMLARLLGPGGATPPGAPPPPGIPPILGGNLSPQNPSTPR